MRKPNALTGSNNWRLIQSARPLEISQLGFYLGRLSRSQQSEKIANQIKNLPPRDGQVLSAQQSRELVECAVIPETPPANLCNHVKAKTGALGTQAFRFHRTVEGS